MDRLMKCLQGEVFPLREAILESDGRVTVIQATGFCYKSGSNPETTNDVEKFKNFNFVTVTEKRFMGEICGDFGYDNGVLTACFADTFDECVAETERVAQSTPMHHYGWSKVTDRLTFEEKFL